MTLTICEKYKRTKFSPRPLRSMNVHVLLTLGHQQGGPRAQLLANRLAEPDFNAESTGNNFYKI